MDIFTEISSIIIVAMLVSCIMRFLKQPLIVGYILTGIIAGPSFLNLIHSGEVFELFSKFGITILLFIVGLHLSPAVIREVGKASLLTGIGQIVFTTIVGFIIARFLGIDRLAAVYVSIALTFSSTIIILKLLSDKGDLHKLYGKIAIGLLLVQDIAATLVLLIISSFARHGGQSILSSASIILMKGGLLITGLMLLSHFILPRLSKYVASSQELLFLFSISWGLGLAALFHHLGFSLEIGALVAGVSLSITPYAYEASSRLQPLRDFFILIFFIMLGSQMVFTNIAGLLFPALILSVFVLIGNPIIMVVIMNLLGFSRRTSFQTGISIAQISEFSLILATLAFQIGHLSQEILSLITFVGLVTIAGSTYFILYSESLYPVVEQFLAFLEIKKNKPDHSIRQEYDSILFGFQRVGQDYVKSLDSLGLHFIVVDFNPESIDLLEKEGLPYIFGDAKDPEFLAELDLKKIRYMISTIPDFETNVFLVKTIRSLNKRAIMIVISHNRDEAVALYAEGASYVIMPHYLGAQYAVRMIGRHGLEKRAYQEARQRHLAYLEKRVV